MADDPRILELVESALCSNLSAEEVCANNPELLADVRDSLEECRDVDRMVESMFPSTAAPAILGAQSQPGAPLPEIPGYEVLAVLGRGALALEIADQPANTFLLVTRTRQDPTPAARARRLLT